MNPRTFKKLKKRIKKIDKAIEKGTLKTYPMEGLKDRMHDLNEKRKHFPHNFYWWLSRCKRKIADKYYYCKCFLFHRYNVVKAKTLPPTWVDRDLLLLHSSFAVFCDVIENEKLLENIGWDHTEQIEEMKKEDWEDKQSQADNIKALQEKHEHDQKLEKELKYLYNWWKVVRPERQEEMSKPSNWDYDKDLKYYEEDTDHLIRLMKIRKTLWT